MIKPQEQTGTEEQAKAVWMHYVQHNKLPEGVPRNPDEVYAAEWKGWCDWLGWTNPSHN